jgi:4-hydroxy-tetrahydrodipicolinate synthase
MKRLFTEPDQRAEIDATLKPLYDAMFITASPGPVKAALHMLGLPAGPLRLPLVECDPDEIAHIRGVLDHLGLLDRATA